MINIAFKDVGQGDSIIIEWRDEDKKGLGIIDCNIYQGQNKVLDYISLQKITEIVDQLCDKVLVNKVIESYTFEVIK